MNITDPIRHFARLTPDAPAVLHFGETFTYSQLNRIIDSLATRFLGMGLAPRDAAGVAVSDTFGHLALTLALNRIGTASVMSRTILEGVGKVAIKKYLMDAANAANAPAGSTLVDSTWWRKPSAGAPAEPVPSCVDGTMNCVFVTSSGTTGTPKAIALSHDMIRTRQFAKWMGVRAPDGARQICTLGVENFYGFSCILRVLWTGGLVATAIPWNEIHVAIPLYQINYLVMSPAQLHKMLEVLPAGSGPFPSIEAVEIGGSALPPSLVAQARAKLCANIVVAYGAAEVGNVASAPAGILERHSGAVGFVAPGAEVQAVDPDHRPLPVGAEGIIRVRNAGRIDGYCGDADATAKAFRDGWFYPGDFGSVSRDGLLTVSGRTGEMINAGGVKVSPRYVEDIVLQNKDVSEAAAFAVPHASTGIDEIWVAIVQKSQVDMKALNAFCVQRLGPAAPKSFLLADALPRNANGKVLLDQLVKMAGTANKIA